MSGITGYVSFVKRYVSAHKLRSAIIVLAVLGGGWLAYGAIHPATATTRYVLGDVSKGTVISTVSGSGQVSAVEQVEIHPKASGEVISILVRNGDQVASGQALAYIDSTTAQNALASARSDLASAQLSLQKLQEPADNLSLIQAQNALTQASADLAQSYDDGYNEAAGTFADLPTAMTGLKNILFASDKAFSSPNLTNLDYYTNQTATIDARATAFRDDVNTKYATALAAYNNALDSYKATPRSASTSTIAALVDTTYTTTKDIADAVQSATNMIQLYKDALTSRNITPMTLADTHLNSLNSYTSQLSSRISNLLNIKNTIITDGQSISEKTASLLKLQAGADTLDVQSSQLTIEQRQNAVTQAENNLADYTIRAPFGGVIANLTLHKGDSASSGTTVATLITHAQVADLSLNEVDAAKIKLGDKATLTFDAIDGLSITGEVSSISPLGTVTQGVVSYDVQITFDTQDTRVKSGMTVNADIQTAVHQNVLIVPSSAIKTQNGSAYVQAFTPPFATSTAQSATAQGIVSATPPVNIPVTVGISDDTNTEIMSGVNEGQQIVVRTVSGTATPATRTAGTSRVGGLGGGGAVLHGL